MDLSEGDERAKAHQLAPLAPSRWRRNALRLLRPTASTGLAPLINVVGKGALNKNGQGGFDEERLISTRFQAF